VSSAESLTSFAFAPPLVDGPPLFFEVPPGLDARAEDDVKDDAALGVFPAATRFKLAMYAVGKRVRSSHTDSRRTAFGCWAAHSAQKWANAAVSTPWKAR
jgi:hypothetical protein